MLDEEQSQLPLCAGSFTVEAWHVERLRQVRDLFSTHAYIDGRLWNSAWDTCKALNLFRTPMPQKQQVQQHARFALTEHHGKELMLDVRTQDFWETCAPKRTREADDPAMQQGKTC